MKATRDGFGEGIMQIARNPKIVVLTADLRESVRVNKFAEKYPKRFIECGVAEQNMAGVAAGLALNGKIPFITSFATFSPEMNLSTIRISICYNNANAKICSTHAGLSTGEDGATHQALEDIALMRTLPNMKVIVPCDSEEARKATIAIAKEKGPFYLRLGRAKQPEIKQDKFVIGKANMLRKGKDCTIIACGTMVQKALEAADELKKKKINCRVLNMHTIKPLDEKAVLKAAKETKRIVTAEEHQVAGGLGSAVAEFLVERYPVPIKMVGVRDKFGQSGTPEQLFEKYGLSSKEIIKRIKELF
ncbi:transketolase family protein [Candidatus Woesearchaeota archaeon]|nr:transketolase family protein [Candidatus Woesearchaeota archaeon]